MPIENLKDLMKVQQFSLPVSRSELMGRHQHSSYSAKLLRYHAILIVAEIAAMLTVGSYHPKNFGEMIISNQS